LHEWAEVCFVDVCDRNAQVASKQRFEGTRLVIRAIDIECWAGQPKGVTWANVDALVFGARHIEELVRNDVKSPDDVLVYRVPFGLDVDKWTYRERDGSGRRVVMIAHRWAAKGIPLALQVMARLGKGWSIHFLGTPSRERWLHAYIDQQIEALGVEATFTERVDSVDSWLEDKDYHLLASYKESFSYATAEAAAKGIKPLVHNFYGASAVWPASWIWNTVDEAVKMLQTPGAYYSDAYRWHIEEHYSLEKMMAGLNAACGIVP